MSVCTCTLTCMQHTLMEHVFVCYMCGVYMSDVYGCIRAPACMWRYEDNSVESGLSTCGLLGFRLRLSGLNDKHLYPQSTLLSGLLYVLVRFLLEAGQW